MSIPLSACYFRRAIDDEPFRALLLDAIQENLACGHFSVWPCPHNPPCKPLTDEECDLLEKALEAHPCK